MSHKNQSLMRAPVTLEGTACAGAELLRSPVSGQSCVHWRLRVVEHITPRMQLVHEMSSPEAFELAWDDTAGQGRDDRPGGQDRGQDGGRDRPQVRVRLEPEAARIHATPVLHREGTPGALAAARHFGLAGPVFVEEVMIRQGEALSVEGVLDDPTAGEGPFRSTGHGLELLNATVHLASRSLGPSLLPWALGTAAALLSSMGLGTWVAWRYHLVHLPAGVSAGAVAGSHPHLPRIFTPRAPAPAPSHLVPPELPHPRMP